MELRTLRSFLAVAREGNVTRAARSLHITQPALSRQLLELERELGCELLVRESRGVTLTDEGALLRKRAEEIVSLADRTELEVRSPEAEVVGDVWVGAGESRAFELLARAASRVIGAHPGVRMRLHSGNADDVIERVDKGLLDFGLIFGREPGSRHGSIRLPYEDHWGVLMRRDDPLAGRECLALDDLRDRRVIASGQGVTHSNEGGPYSALFGREGYTVGATFTLLYNASLLVEQGAGVAITFDGIVNAGEGTPFALVPLDGVAPVPSYLFWKRHQPLSRACDLFLKEVRSVCDEAPQA